MEHKFENGFCIEHDEFDSSYKQLQAYAKDKAKKVVSEINLNPGDFGSFGIWTDGVPELICIAKFVCESDNTITWEFDESLSTL